MVRAKARPLRTSARRQAPRIVIQQIMEEKKKTPYIHLQCGCITTWETQEGYAVWRPKRNKQLLYCEKGHGWVMPKPEPKPEPLPDEPLF